MIFIAIILFIIVFLIIANNPSNTKKRALKSWMNYGAAKHALTLTQTFLLEDTEENIETAAKIFEEIIIANGISAHKYTQNLLFGSSGGGYHENSQSTYPLRGPIYFKTPSAYNSYELFELFISLPRSAPKWSLFAFPDVWRWYIQILRDLDEDKISSNLLEDLKILADIPTNIDTSYERSIREKDNLEMVKKLVEIYKKHARKPLECRASFF
jgi:hypothetical protein